MLGVKALRLICGHKGILIMWDVKYDLMFNQDDLESNICLIFVKSLPPSRAVKLHNDITTPVQSASGQRLDSGVLPHILTPVGFLTSMMCHQINNSFLLMQLYLLRPRSALQPR